MPLIGGLLGWESLFVDRDDRCRDIMPPTGGLVPIGAPAPLPRTEELNEPCRSPIDGGLRAIGRIRCLVPSTFGKGLRACRRVCQIDAEHRNDLNADLYLLSYSAGQHNRSC